MNNWRIEQRPCAEWLIVIAEQMQLATGMRVRPEPENDGEDVKMIIDPCTRRARVMEPRFTRQWLDSIAPDFLIEEIVKSIKFKLDSYNVEEDIAAWNSNAYMQESYPMPQQEQREYLEQNAALFRKGSAWCDSWMERWYGWKNEPYDDRPFYDRAKAWAETIQMPESMTSYMDMEKGTTDWGKEVERYRIIMERYDQYKTWTHAWQDEPESLWMWMLKYRLDTSGLVN